eukprot:COSAG04_NODE_16067_length_510_cov_5.420925_1_plen_35_part_10
MNANQQCATNYTVLHYQKSQCENLCLALAASRWLA